MENKELKNLVLKIVHFNDTTKFPDFSFGNILFNEKSYKNICIYEVSNKTLIGAKPSHILFDKVYRLVRDYYGTEYLALFGLKKHNAIYERIRYL